MTRDSNSARRLAGPRSQWLQAFSLMSAVFLFGIIVGAAVVYKFLWEKHVETIQAPRFEEERILRRMQADFEVTEEQSKQLASIFAEHHTKMRSINESVRSQVDGQIDSLRSQVEAVLTPDQVDQWDKKFDEMRRTWLPPAHRPRGSSPDGRGPGFHPPPRFAFENADADHDGALTLEEFSAGLPHETEERFESLDTDNDGRLSFEEFRAGGPPPPPRRHRPRP